MKKTGFTLAEVLITLAIIGVVATMTLPALMNNTQEQQARTGLKKVINTLTHAAEMNLAGDGGFDYSGITEESDTTSNDSSTSASIYAMLASYGAVDPSKSGTNVTGALSSTNFVVTFRDNTTVEFTNANLSNSDTNADILADNLPRGIAAVVDINGEKGPNILSNCTSSLSNADTPTDAADGATECTKANKVIKDKFGVRLRGGRVSPNGPAARYAYDR